MEKTLFNRELCEVIVAVRHYYKRWYCKQVVVHGIHTEKVFLRDIALIAGFYAIGWYRDGISKYEHWYDYDWGYNDEKYFNMYAPIVNQDFILTLPEYKYSAVNLYPHNDVLQYLKAFEQYPQAELLVKANLGEYATSKMILRQCAKDKQFCKWLYQNRNEVKHSGYVSSIIRAYKQKRSVKEMYAYDNFKKSFDRPDNFKRLKEMFTGAERKKSNTVNSRRQRTYSLCRKNELRPKVCTRRKFNFLYTKSVIPKYTVCNFGIFTDKA